MIDSPGPRLPDYPTDELEVKKLLAPRRPVAGVAGNLGLRANCFFCPQMAPLPTLKEALQRGVPGHIRMRINLIIASCDGLAFASEQELVRIGSAGPSISSSSTSLGGGK